MRKFALAFVCATLCYILILSAASAVCPVCTIAIGAGLEGMRMMGVKDVITGIWAGGLTMSLIGWTANYMYAHGVRRKIWYGINFLVYIALLASVYFIPIGKPFVKWWENCMWGIDQFLLGSVVGALVFLLMELWYMRIKRNHGGHAMFPFQKVVMPFVGLLVATGIFWVMIRWLPKIGIVIC